VIRSAARRTLGFALAFLVAGCALHRESVILLPDKDGRATAVVVKQGAHEVVLDKPYAAAQLSLADPWTYRASAEEVQASFAAALAAQPERAAHFTLYFVEGNDELTEDSKASFEAVFADLARRGIPDVLVIGHTDAVGSDPFNDALARQRAESVRAALIRRGLAPEAIVAEGRGKREPLVPTPAGIAEPRNRRVEIIVR
jgi:outer membrane protein OmpA-like peptidoglycan-associated protein